MAAAITGVLISVGYTTDYDHIFDSLDNTPAIDKAKATAQDFSVDKGAPNPNATPSDKEVPPALEGQGQVIINQEDKHKPIDPTLTTGLDPPAGSLSEHTDTNAFANEITVLKVKQAIDEFEASLALDLEEARLEADNEISNTKSAIDEIIRNTDHFKQEIKILSKRAPMWGTLMTLASVKSFTSMISPLINDACLC